MKISLINKNIFALLLLLITSSLAIGQQNQLNSNQIYTCIGKKIQHNNLWLDFQEGDSFGVLKLQFNDNYSALSLETRTSSNFVYVFDSIKKMEADVLDINKGTNVASFALYQTKDTDHPSYFNLTEKGDAIHLMNMDGIITTWVYGCENLQLNFK